MKRASLFAAVLFLVGCPAVKDDNGTTDSGARDPDTGTTGADPDPAAPKPSV